MTCRRRPRPRPSRRRPQPTEIAGLGIKLAPMSPELRKKYQLGDDQKGVVVTDVAPNAPAAQRGLKAGDVIVEVQQGEVSTPAEVQQRVDSVRKEDRKSVLMLIQRQDGMQWVPVPLPAGRRSSRADRAGRRAAWLCESRA